VQRLDLLGAIVAGLSHLSLIEPASEELDPLKREFS
jgi:hypothetical protein